MLAISEYAKCPGDESRGAAQEQRDVEYAVIEFVCEAEFTFVTREPVAQSVERDQVVVYQCFWLSVVRRVSLPDNLTVVVIMSRVADVSTTKRERPALWLGHEVSK